MHRCLPVLCLAALLAAAPVNAGKTPSQLGEPSPLFNCDIEYGWSYTDGTFYSVPDCGSAIRMPMTVTATGIAGSVVVSLYMQHTWIGDANLSLEHDSDCDGVAEDRATLLCRAGLFDPSCPLSGCCGCSDDVDGLYSFDDTALNPVLGDPFSPCFGGFAAPGCYRTVSVLAVFAGKPIRGCWALVGQDGYCGDPFYVYGWSLHVMGGGTPTEVGTWGSIKHLYR